MLHNTPLPPSHPRVAGELVLSQSQPPPNIPPYDVGLGAALAAECLAEHACIEETICAKEKRSAYET
jgi:hypothetical protein